MESLKNKVIIVTGGSGLIGKAIVENISFQNGKVINADINVETDITKGRVYCDITKSNSVDELIEIVLAEYGRIDGLVNNGYPRTEDWGNKFEDVSLDSWKENVDMQMNSTFYICQKILGTMKSQGAGSIVNIASIYGVQGNDFTVYENTGGMTSPAAYSAIKGGIINFSRYLASYYGSEGIRVNVVSPGGIFNNQNPIFVKNFEKKVPMKRMGTPEDIAPSVSFLLSDGAKYITGHNLIVDGGWTAI